MPFRPTQKLIIGIPYYNHPELLNRTLARLAELTRSQHFDLSVIISDDASPMAPDLAKIPKHQSIRYVRQPHNLGLVGNYNWCTQAFRQEGPAWTLILDSDDIPTEHAFHEVLNSSINPAVGMVIGGYEIVNLEEPGKVIKTRSPAAQTTLLNSKAAFQWVYSRNRTASSGVWIHSDAYTETTYDPECHYCCDWDFYIRLASRSSVVLSNKVFCTVLHHPHNNTWEFMKSGEARRNERITLRKNWGLTEQLHIPNNERIALKAMAIAHFIYRSFHSSLVCR